MLLLNLFLAVCLLVFGVLLLMIGNGKLNMKSQDKAEKVKINYKRIKFIGIIVIVLSALCIIQIIEILRR